jgi:hypothetical protein
MDAGTVLGDRSKGAPTLRTSLSAVSGCSQILAPC